MKYYPLIVTSLVSLALLFVVMIYSSAKLLILGGTIADTGVKLFEILKVGGIIIFLPIFLSWVYGEVKSRDMNKTVSSFVFSLSGSIGFVIFIALLSLYKHGDFLEDAMTEKGLMNLGILISMFFGMCIALYLSLTRRRY